VVNLINLNDEEFDKTSAIKETIDNMQSSNLDDVIKSGIYKLDDFIFGFMLCDFIIVAGATSMGKTAFALRLFLNLIMQGMYPAFFSLEMSSQQLISRLLAMISNVGLSDIRRRSLTDSQWEKMHLAVATLEEQKFTIDDKSGNLNQISNKIRKYHIKYGTKVFFIDYIQLVKVNLGKRANREQEVATISRTLKELCRELKIIIISLSQLSREVSKRTNHRPMLSDLRESGAIEQDADFVLFPYRPAYYDTFETQIPYIEDATLIIAKGRGTGLKDIDMKFISTRTNYLNGEPNEDENEDTPF
jgi:replicative DNA helicase